MNGLPRPPDAYWANIPWWGYIGFLAFALLVLFVLGPWMIQRARQTPSSMRSREEMVAAREKAEYERLAVDRDLGWNIARGCLPLMHVLWHDLVNTIQERNALLALCKRILDGQVLPEAARDRLLDYVPRAPPSPLPDLKGVEPKRPGETKYA